MGRVGRKKNSVLLYTKKRRNALRETPFHGGDCRGNLRRSMRTDKRGEAASVEFSEGQFYRKGSGQSLRQGEVS